MMARDDRHQCWRIITLALASRHPLRMMESFIIMSSSMDSGYPLDIIQESIHGGMPQRFDLGEHASEGVDESSIPSDDILMSKELLLR